ncbi:MAG TPA: GDSL-type esterase/lipase family protein [Myxococcota bacterium]|nr:GDSL-type esterase/lipase family protein [Myxococcota bacterium]
MIRHRLRRIASAALPTVATLVAFELILRAFPGLVPIDVGTAIYSVYGTGPGDIYFYDEPTRANFMWPNYRTRAYWNGYVWEHRTDELGFRNPDDLNARSIVWLGDSMIYGHGVEEEDTAVARLRREHGLAAYNAGRQGDCLYQEYLVARLLLREVAPRTLVLSVFMNDFEDLEVYRTPEEIAVPPELSLDVGALAARLEHPVTRFRPRRELQRLKLWRLADLVGKRIGKRRAAPPADAGPPSFVRPLVEDARWTPIANYYERMIGDLAERSRAAGAELVLLDLDIGDQVIADARPGLDRLHELLASIAREHALRLLDTRSSFETCKAACFLPHDGHLSPEGHRRLADLVASALREPGPV